jgi:hypothetical protein
MARSNNWPPWGVERKSPSGYPDRGGPPDVRGRSTGMSTRMSTRTSMGCSPPGMPRPRGDSGPGGANAITIPRARKKKAGAGASVTPARRQQRSGAWGLRRLVTAGAAAGAAPAARSRQQYGWSKPKLRSTRVRSPRQASSCVRRPEGRDSKDAMQGGPNSGGLRPPAWNRAERSGRPTLSLLRGVVCARPMPTACTRTSTRFPNGLRDHGIRSEG